MVQGVTTHICGLVRRGYGGSALRGPHSEQTMGRPRTQKAAPALSNLEVSREDGLNGNHGRVGYLKKCLVKI